MSFDNGREQRNQNRTFIIAAAVDQPTFSYSVKFKYRTNASEEDEFESGINVEIFKYLCDSLNFTGKALKSRGQMKADEHGDLVNEGIAAALNSGFADIAISLYELIPYRMAGPFGVRFLHSVFDASKAIAVFTQPPKTSARNIYGRPFQADVWQGIIGLLIFITLFMTIILLFKFKCKVNDNICHICGYIKLFVLCTFSRQGCVHDLITHRHNNTTALKATLIVCFVSSFIFHSIFSSALTSIFAIDVNPISTFEQLANKQYKIYYDKYVPSIQNNLVDFQTKGITVIEMGHTIKSTMQQTAPQIFASQAVLLTTAERYYPYFKEQYSDGFLCSKLATLPFPSDLAKSSIFVKQGSPLREKFNVKLLLMKETGLIERLYKEHNIRTRLNCFESEKSEIVTLDLYDTAFPFLILVCVAVITLGVLIFENVIWKWKPNFNETIF